MAVYNGEPYIHNAISSVLEQDFTEFEFVIVDDCSTDSTADIIAAFNDERIKYFKNKKNIGQTKSLNVGLNKSTSKYIARIDADDLFLPNKLSEQFHYMESNPEVAACGTGSVKIDEDGHKIGLHIPPLYHDDIVATMLYRSPMVHVSILMRRDCIISLKGYNENFPICADYDLWSRLICNNFRLANIPNTLTCYRLLNTSVGSVNFFENSVNEVAEIMHNYWKETTDVPIKVNQCKTIALILRPEAGLSILKICEAYKMITSARKKITFKWNYFDKTAIDIFKIFLWSFIKNNNYNKNINGTKVMIINNLKSLYKFFDYPVLIMFIITSMTLSLIPEKLIKLIKANISS